MDIIFVNINSNELDFEQYIKPLEERWSKFINKDDDLPSSWKNYFEATLFNLECLPASSFETP